MFRNYLLNGPLHPDLRREMNVGLTESVSLNLIQNKNQLTHNKTVLRIWAVENKRGIFGKHSSRGLNIPPFPFHCQEYNIQLRTKVLTRQMS